MDTGNVRERPARARGADERRTDDDLWAFEGSPPSAPRWDLSPSQTLVLIAMVIVAIAIWAGMWVWVADVVQAAIGHLITVGRVNPVR